MSKQGADAAHSKPAPFQPAKDEIPKEQPSDYNDPVDEAADESFPDSDPPSFTETSVSREPADREP